MKARISAVIALVAVVALVLTACGNTEDGKVTTTKAETTTTGGTSSSAPSSTQGQGLISDLSESISEGMSEAGSDVSRMMD